MTRTEALELLREYAEHQSKLWEKTPEGQMYMARFNEAIDTLAAERDRTDSELTEDVVKAVNEAWRLKQKYWHGKRLG